MQILKIKILQVNELFFGDSNSTISGYILASDHLNITAEFFFSVIFSNQ